eukprot:Gb_39252 [translate_table: standard]
MVHDSHPLISQLGGSITSGLVVIVMIYSVHHIFGAHMNPTATIAFAMITHFPWIILELNRSVHYLLLSHFASCLKVHPTLVFCSLRYSSAGTGHGDHCILRAHVHYICSCNGYKSYNYITPSLLGVNFITS